MAKEMKVQDAENYSTGGVTYSEWSKDDFFQEQFKEWMEDGNVHKFEDGYSTQDAQWRNRLKNMSDLKRYFYKEFIKGQYNSYAGGGSTDDKHLIAKAIEYITGYAVDTDSIVKKGFTYNFTYKGRNVASSLDSKLIDDTIRMNKKSLESRYAQSSATKYMKGGEADFDDAGTSLAMYHETKGNWLVPKGQVYLWLYDVENSAEKIESGEFDYVQYPLTSMSMAWQRGYIPPLKRIWTKKFQKMNKGSEHLLGVIKAFLINENGKEELYIDMMSVNPNKKKKGIMSYMIKDLRNSFNLSQDQVTFSELTKEGEKFVAKKTYEGGGGVEENNYRISISENDKYIGEYPNPIGSITEAKAIFVQLATKYKRPQYLISVSSMPTSTSGYEKINVDEWYNFAESFKDGGEIKTIADLKKYLVYKNAGFNYHYVIGDYKFEINEFNDQKGWALNTFKKYKYEGKENWELVDSYGYEGLTLRECKQMILQELSN